MRIGITGSSGLVGTAVRRRLESDGMSVVRIVRSSRPAENHIVWDPLTGDTDASQWEGLDAVVHLAGENIAKRRWTNTQKARIRASRVEGTRHLCRILTSLERPPSVLVAASAIGYYGDRGDEELDESSPPGEGFLAEVCQEWEAASRVAEEAGIRVVRLRIGVVLARDGGALAAMLRPFRWGLGGRVGSGRQFWSWIELGDLAEICYTALNDTRLAGPVNAVSPHPVRNADFTRTLASVLKRPAIFPLPAWVVRAMLGEMGEELLLASTRVVPRRFLTLSFPYRYAELEAALRHLLTESAS